MPTENKIGANIASLRRARGLTQAELARQLHYTHQTVSNWERGISEPDAETLLRLSAFFGVSADEILIGRQGSAFAEEGAEEDKEAPGAAPVHNRGFRVSPTSAREHAVFLDAEAFSLRESAAAAEKARTVPVRRRRRVKASDLRTVLIVCTACTFVRYFFSLFGNAAALVFIALSAGLAESALRLAAAILFFFRQGPVFGAGLRFDRRVLCSWRSGRGRAPVSAVRISRSDSVLLRRGACLHDALLVRVSLRVSSGA